MCSRFECLQRIKNVSMAYHIENYGCWPKPVCSCHKTHLWLITYIGVIHKGRLHRGGGGRVRPNADKSGQGGRGVSVKAEVRIYTWSSDLRSEHQRSQQPASATGQVRQTKLTPVVPRPQHWGISAETVDEWDEIPLPYYDTALASHSPTNVAWTLYQAAKRNHSRVHRHTSDATVEATEDPHHLSAGGSSGPADSSPVVRNLFDWLQLAFADADSMYLLCYIAYS